MRVLLPGACPAVRAAAVAALILSGHVPTASSKEDLENLRSDEGIVFGSVLLTILPGETGFLGGRKAADLEYVVTITSTGANAAKIILRVIPGKEEFFVKRMPASLYVVSSLKPDSVLFGGLNFPMGMKFEVTPGQTNYIGRLALNLPERIRLGARFGYSIQDVRQETIDKLGGEYPSLRSAAVSALAAPERGPRIVPGDTMAGTQLQQDTVKVITTMDEAEDAACGKRSIVNTEVIKRPTPQDLTGQERWTLDRCGFAVRYLVNFDGGSPRGGTDIAVKKEP